jgi:subtilisin family serine protease
MGFLFSAFLVSTSTSWAATTPYLDNTVRNFIYSSEPVKAQSTLSTIISFEESHLANLSELKLADRPTRIRLLKKDLEKKVKILQSSLGSKKKFEFDLFWLVGGIRVNLTADQIKNVLKSQAIKSVTWSQRPITLKIEPQQKLHTNLESFTYGLTKIGVPEVRSRFPNLTGSGVRVGILDTGIMSNHPDLIGKIRVFKNFSPSTDSSVRDDFGHGTHVAGTISGGASSGIEIGVAPEAELIIGRIFDRNGNSTDELILKAMQWMADPDENPDTSDYAQVINNSWSDSEPYTDKEPGSNLFCQAVSAWVNLDMIPVFSAGNTGPKSGTINLPAGCPDAFSVGATEQNDRSPHFSSTGPAKWKNQELAKPEVSAPGFKVKSASKSGKYEEMSGTSMAAPHVTGAFAILLQAFPEKNINELRSAMILGAKDLGDPGPDSVFGWGRIDIKRSLEILDGQ